MQRRRPVQIRTRRSPADVVVGLLAIIVLAALLGGVPYALVRFLGSPLPEEGLSLDLLTQEVGLSTVLDLLTLLVWGAWLQLVVCVLVELWAAIRKIGVPAKVPFARGPQALAHRLVTAALLLFTTTSVVMPAIGAATADRPATPAVTSVTAGPTEEQERTVLTPVAKTKKVYTVQPPEGRHHESLWEIAEKCLGEGRRYKEIYELNKHKVQPDGSRLRISDLIRPGWVLDMPDDAINVHVVPVEEDKPEILEDHRDKPSSLDGRTAYLDPGAAARSGPADPAPARDGYQVGDRAPAPAPRPGDVTADSGGLEGIALPEFLAAASLAAAGLLAALGHRRRRQLWERAFGRRLPEPEPEAARAEMALLLGADTRGTRVLDLGLRHLSRALAEQGRPLPTVFAGFLAPTHLDLWIHPADRNAPAPWTAVDNGSVWRITAEDALRLPEEPVAHTLAPYPGLVSLGTNEGGRVLVDLEAAHGLINLRGRPHIVAAALAAIAVELATNSWSDHMKLVLVGFGADLSLIAPDRITVVSSLAEALPELEARTADVQRALHAAGADSVLTGRARGVYGEAWMPTYLLSAVPPTPREAAVLTELARTGTRMATGYLVAGEEVPGASWIWDLSPDGRASIKALGLEVRGQLLPEQQYHQVIKLFRGTTEAPVPMPRPEPSGTLLAQLNPVFRPAVEVRLLGPIEVVTARPLEPERLPLCTELVAYLATHPGGVHPRVLGGALWPRGVEAQVRDAVITRTVDWLGLDSQGRPNLYTDADGRLHLGPQVRVDWQIFRELVRQAAADPAREAALLEQALRLVRGPLLHGRPPGRYLWLAGDILSYEVSARVSDAAHRLCELRRAAGDARGAVEAALAGLRLTEGDELLWRDLLRAVHATGDLEAVRHWVGVLRQKSGSSRFRGRLMPETEALIEELLPTPAYQRAG